MFCLQVPTDVAWARRALREPDVMLRDHAHCEMKAASNALALAARQSGDTRLVRALSELAREELDHFQRVLSVLERRGITLGPPPVDAYAAALRREASERPRPRELPPVVDRLLVAALIEARSCERFKLLIEALEGDRDAELFTLYTDLFPAEARHYRVFIDLAAHAADASAVHARLHELAAREARIVSRLAAHGPCATIHG